MPLVLPSPLQPWSMLSLPWKVLLSRLLSQRLGSARKDAPALTSRESWEKRPRRECWVQKVSSIQCRHVFNLVPRLVHLVGWKAPAEEWHKFGIVQQVVPLEGDPGDAASQAKNEEKLVEAAVEVAQEWAAKGKRMTPAEIDELKAVNARESEELATCFLSEPFLKGQYEFAKSKGKNDVARLFYTLRVTRPLWSLLL